MEFLSWFWNEMQGMLVDWPVGTIAGVLVIVVVLFLVVFVLWGVFIAIDSWFLPRKRKVGRVVGRTFTPAHTQPMPIYNAATKSTHIHLIHHPDNWSLTVQVDDLQDSVSVDEEFYDYHTAGKQVWVEYVTGRFSGGLYIKGLSRV